MTLRGCFDVLIMLLRRVPIGLIDQTNSALPCFPPSDPGPLDVNLAQGRYVWQISTYGSAAAERAVDGNYDPEWSHNSIAMTNNHEHPWWAVDFGQSYELDHVELTGRNWDGESAELASYPGYFREPHWCSMGLPELSRVTLTATGAPVKVISQAVWW